MRMLTGLFLIFLLVSCVSDNLNEVVYNEVLPQIRNADKVSFQIRATRTFDEGIIVLFSADDALNPPDKLVGFSVFTRNIVGWNHGMDGVWARDITVLSDPLIDYKVSDIFYGKAGQNFDFGHRLIWGEIFSSDVTSVTITLDDGTILRDNGLGMIYAISIAKPHIACEIRALGKNGNLLETITPEYNQNSVTLSNCRKQ